MDVGRRIGWLLAAALPLLCAPAGTQAGETARISRVIELFTSQGCPKCPAADQLIGDIAREPDTVALSFPVDTWDYGGWKDTLASPASTQRQHAYAAARGDDLIYTPQVVVDGLQAQPGADRSAIVQTSDTLKDDAAALRVLISLSEANGRLVIAVGEATGAESPSHPVRSPADGPVGVYVLRVARAATVSIDRGENSGRSLTYTNVVRAMQKIGDWGGVPVRFDLVDLKAEDEGYVVLLQAGTPVRLGAILAAAKTPGL